MNVADQSTPEARVTPETLSLSVRISANVASRLSADIKRLRLKEKDLGGLLFGVAERDCVHVEALKSFPQRAWRIARSPQGTLHALLSACRGDPELRGLDWVGWYSDRISGGFTQDDFDFHNGHFRRPCDVALLAHPGDGPEVVLELYSCAGALPLTETNNLHGVACLSTAPEQEDVNLTLKTGNVKRSSIEAISDKPIIGPVEARVEETPPLAYAARAEVPAEPESRAPAGIVQLPTVPQVSRPVGVPDSDPGLPEGSPGPDSSQLARKEAKRRPRRVALVTAIMTVAASSLILLVYTLSAGRNTFSFSRWLSSSGPEVRVARATRQPIADSTTAAVPGELSRPVVPDSAKPLTYATPIRPDAQESSASIKTRPASGTQSKVGLAGSGFHAVDRQAGLPADSVLAAPVQVAPSAPHSPQHWPLAPVELWNAADHRHTSSEPAASKDLSLSTALVPQLKIESQGVRESSALEPAATSSKDLSPIGLSPADKPKYVPPQPLRRVLPGVTRMAPEIAESTAAIEVQVKVDSRGHVTAARVVRIAGNASSVLREAVLEAAKQWIFVPAKLRGIAVEADCNIVFQFHLAH